eukprot:5287217-Lingulodinium_polyedra.AAC.1
MVRAPLGQDGVHIVVAREKEDGAHHPGEQRRKAICGRNIPRRSFATLPKTFAGEFHQTCLA